MCQGDRCDQSVHQFYPASDTLAPHSDPPEFGRRRYVERKNSITIALGFQPIDRSHETILATPGRQAFDAVTQFGQHRRTQKESRRRLCPKPIQHCSIGLWPPCFRDDVRVEDNHSKSGGLGKLPLYSKTRSSPRSSGLTNPARKVPMLKSGS